MGCVCLLYCPCILREVRSYGTCDILIWNDVVYIGGGGKEGLCVGVVDYI